MASEHSLGRTNVSQMCCCFSNTTIPFDASSIFSNSTFSPKGAITFPAHEYVWLKVKDCSAKPISARRARFVPYYSGAPESFKKERHAYKNSNVNFAHCWSCFQSSYVKLKSLVTWPFVRESLWRLDSGYLVALICTANQ